MIHELKTWPQYFQDIKEGKKTFEIRKNDRNYQVGDVLLLKEWEPKGYSSVDPNTLEGEYTGEEMKVHVTYIMKSMPEYISYFGIGSGVVVMSILLMKYYE
jgi:ASC-1-like (ASCH) protein